MSSRRRHRVVVRPQVRARRVRAGAAAAAVLLLGAIAVAGVRRALKDFRVPAWPSPSGGLVVVEAPEPLRSLAQAQADATPGTLGEKAAAVKAKFPCVLEVKPRRAWTDSRSTLLLELRAPVARAVRQGRPAGFLDREGGVYPAPEGLFELTGPVVDADGAPVAELAVLAREWPTLSAPGAFPAELVEMAYRGADAGWEARLADGAVVSWGRLDWTREKLARLAEAVADARRREPGAFSADLRWFEDGKVLLKAAVPTGARR